VPELGAKIVSIFDKTHQYEWLVPPMRMPQPLTYGADFVSQDMSGWDEMMPTINACRWNGIPLPDHGEVWSIPWQVEGLDGEVSLAVQSKVMPYRLKRSAILTAPDQLELRYTITHTGSNMPIPYLWAAHPQFAADPQTRIQLPPEITQVVNVVESDPVWGEAETVHAWPQAVGINGQIVNLDRVASVQQHACRKFYLPPEQPVASAALIHEGLGCSLRLNWSASDLPFLGIWIDEGTYNTNPVAALEPSTGYYDGLDRAVANGKAPVLEPGQEKHWTLTVSIGEGEK
jgi:galactose mutarotase-like enzyme